MSSSTSGSETKPSGNAWNSKFLGPFSGGPHPSWGAPLNPTNAKITFSGGSRRRGGNPKKGQKSRTMKNRKDFTKWLLRNCCNKDPFFYAIYAKRHKQYCGMASYLRITPEHGSIEVGHINYSPLLQNTVEGTETMYLMMYNAFDKLGNRRYEWKCNNLNQDSKKAALRLGFAYEGVFRQMNVFKGRNRDTAWFSIIDSEWKYLKKRYRKYLSKRNFDQNFIQKQKL